MLSSTLKLWVSLCCPSPSLRPPPGQTLRITAISTSEEPSVPGLVGSHSVLQGVQEDHHSVCRSQLCVGSTFYNGGCAASFLSVIVVLLYYEIKYVVKSFGVSIVEGKDVPLDHDRGRRVPIYRYLLEGPTFSASKPGSENSPTPPPRLSPNLCTQIFLGAYGLSKHLPVFLLGTENVMGGGGLSKHLPCVSLRYRKHCGGVDGNTGSGLW